MIASSSFGLALVTAFQLALRPATPALARADSTRTLKYARSAQGAFEAFRRTRLPEGESSAGQDCDARIGRFCYWRDDENDDDDDSHPQESPAVRERRTALIHVLDSTATLMPGDRWISGQRVRYLVEAERTDDALAAADQCRADRWWCAALGGYAAHVAARFDVADSLFEIALDAMTPAQRCDWTDIHNLIEGDLAGRVAHAPCAEREALTRKIFWLGSPLWSVSATDLLTEHLARQTQTLIAERAASAEGTSFANDVRTLIIRYGWSKWYTRGDSPLGSPFDIPVTGHDAGKAYYFLPSSRMLDSGPSVRPDWQLDDARAVSGYAPSYARSVHEIPAQVSAFRRGDSTLVIGAWDVRRDSLLVGRNLTAAIVLAAPGDIRSVSRATDQKGVGHLQTTALIDSGWISLELLAATERRAGRLRVGLSPRVHGRLGLSDLLLFAPTTDAADLAVARDSALATDVVPASRALGVFWETYGLAPQGEHARFALAVEQIEIGWRQRAAERLHLSDPTSAMHLQWEELATVADGINAHGIRVNLGQLRSGRYRLELRVTADNGATAVTSREIEVRDR